jgi:hypothetical protein
MLFAIDLVFVIGIVPTGPSLPFLERASQSLGAGFGTDGETVDNVDRKGTRPDACDFAQPSTTRSRTRGCSRRLRVRSGKPI